MNTVQIVAPNNVYHVWEDIKEYLNASINVSGGDYTLEQLMLLLSRGEQTLLVSVNEKERKVLVRTDAGGEVYLSFDELTNSSKTISESVKAEEKETSKEVKSKQDAYDATDVKNADNINGNEIWKGYYVEMKDPANADKTGDELKKIVVKNLSKDPLYYTKKGMFGIKGIGYTDEAPGLGKNTQPTSKNASVLGGRDEVNSDSDVVKNSLVGSTKKNVKDTLSGSEAKTLMPKKVKEMSVTPQNSSGVKKMKMPGAEKRIKLKEGLSLAELLAEPEENSLNKKMNDFNNYSDSELIQWAKDDGMEESIVLNSEGGLENRNELLSALTGIENLDMEESINENVSDKDIQIKYNEMFGKNAQTTFADVAKALNVPEDQVQKVLGMMRMPFQESKLRSVISKLIKEELDKDESDLDARLKKYVENEVSTGDWESIKNYYKEMTQDKPDPKRKYFELVDGILKKYGY